MAEFCEYWLFLTRIFVFLEGLISTRQYAEGKIREGRDDFFPSGDLFGSFQDFGGFGSHRSMMPSLFGERDPFNDPFFTRPFGSLFDSGRFGSSGKDQTSGATRIVIEERISDDEGLNEEDEH
jgi:hypothetical protein